jgi:hypothetical protein
MDYIPGMIQPHAPGWLTWDSNENAFIGSVTANNKGYLCECPGPPDENNNPTTVQCYYTLVSPAKMDTSSSLSATDDHVDASVEVSFEWGEDNWTGGGITPCVWQNVSLTLTLDGSGVDGHAMTVKPTEIVANIWMADANNAGKGNWVRHTLSGDELDAVSGVFTQFRNMPPDGQEELVDIGSGGVITVGGSNTWSGSTDENGKIAFQQICFANELYVTEKVKLEAEDTSVIE